MSEAALAQSHPSANDATPAVVTVPFVGCRSDGQVGELKPPTGEPKVVHVAAKLAARLAYYKAENGPGVLAPRGWECFGTYGSSGASLFVAPQPLRFPVGAITGPAIQASDSLGDTSGRFEVASILARVFPSERDFVQNVINEGMAPATDFPFGPYPKDKLKYQSTHVVEYETPGGSDGLGTRTMLQKSAASIHGAIIFDPRAPALSHLAVRVPSDLADLVAPTMRQFEQDYPPVEPLLKTERPKAHQK
jgi:hypothetical protein